MLIVPAGIQEKNEHDILIVAEDRVTPTLTLRYGTATEVAANTY